jgi:hypothetical protein
MELKIARIISYVFHPLLMPVYAFLLLFNMDAYFASVLSFKGKLIILSFVFLSTFVFPSFFTYILYKRNFISSMHLEKKEDRNIPFIFTIIFYYGAYYMLKNNEGIPAIYLILMLVSTLMIILAFFVNLKFKISIHSLSIGALNGLLIGVAYRFQLDLSLIIMVSILIAGFIGYARMAMRAHRPSEIYTGFLIGFWGLILLFFFL